MMDLVNQMQLLLVENFTMQVFNPGQQVINALIRHSGQMMLIVKEQNNNSRIASIQIGDNITVILLLNVSSYSVKVKDLKMIITN